MNHVKPGVTLLDEFPEQAGGYYKKPNWFQKFLCWLGWHGPYQGASQYSEPFVQFCPFCGMRWYGDEIECGYGVNAYRSVGDWKTRAECIRLGLWGGDRYKNQKV